MDFIKAFLESAFLYVLAVAVTTGGILLGIQLRKNKSKKQEQSS